jgi:signal transduction histidine kinase
MSAFGDQGGIGLASMKERAEKLGGDLIIDSSPNQGTKVKATLDVQSAATNFEEETK